MSQRTSAGVRWHSFVAGAGVVLLAGTLAAGAVQARVSDDALRIAPTSDATVLAATTSRIRVVGPSSATATGRLITVRVDAITTVPLSGAQASVVFDRSRLRLVDVTPGEAWAAPTAMLAGFPTKEDADGLLSSANAAGMVAQFAAFFADGKSYLRAGEVELASLTFEVTACGDTRIDVPLGPLDGVLLDGRASTYGQAVELGGADSASILIDCGLTETPPPAAKSSRPAVDSQSTASSSCPTIDANGSQTFNQMNRPVAAAFAASAAGTSVTVADTMTDAALSDLAAGTVQVAGSDRTIMEDDPVGSLYAWQIGTYVWRPIYLAVRTFTLANRFDNTTLVKGDDYLNYMLSPAGQSSLGSVLGFQALTNPPAIPPIPDFDVNLDGGVSVLDLGQVTAKWGQTSACKGWIRADVNNDGGISVLDLGQVTAKWGQPGFVVPEAPAVLLYVDVFGSQWDDIDTTGAAGLFSASLDNAYAPKAVTDNSTVWVAMGPTYAGSDAIWVNFGHGNAGYITWCSPPGDPSCTSVLRANADVAPERNCYRFDGVCLTNYGTALHHIRLMVFAGCKTGRPGPNNASLLTTAVDVNGADAALGFDDEIFFHTYFGLPLDPDRVWAEQFPRYLNQGRTIDDAARAAAQDVANHDWPFPPAGYDLWRTANGGATIEPPAHGS